MRLRSPILTPYLLMVIAAFLMTGCKSLPTQIPGLANTTLPDWYRQIPADAESFYAVGEGISFKESERNARESLAGQVRVDVQARVKTGQVSDGDYQHSYFKSESVTYVSDIALVNARVFKQEKVGVHCYSLIKVDKSSLIIQQSTQLNSDVNVLKRALKGNIKASFDNWYALKKLGNTAKRVENNLTFLAVIGGQDKNYDAKEAATFSKKYYQLLNKAQENSSIRIVNRSGIKTLSGLMNKIVSSEGIRVDHSRFGSSSTLMLMSDSKKQKIGDDMYVDGVLSIRLLSKQGSVLAQKKLKKTIILPRTQSGASARLGRHYYDALKDQKIVKSLISGA